MTARPDYSPRLSPIRARLAALLAQADRRAECDPVPERRARHRKLARFLIARIAQEILKEAGHEPA
jgi:hypothetical protein